jgi:hypothetical protein
MRVFEFEKVDEGVVKNMNGICVIVSDHAFDRMNTRTSITPEILNILLKRIPDVRNKFKPLEPGMPFKIWSKSLNLGLGMRKQLDKDGYQRVLVATVLDKPLFDNVDDLVFYVG